MRNGEKSLLVGDLLLKHPDLEGLDAAVEIFAVDIPEVDLAGSSWGHFWADPLQEAPPLPDRIRFDMPEEGGFMIRPISVADRQTGNAAEQDSLIPDSSRRVLVPNRQVHADLGFPEPTLISNEIFLEIRYAMAPSVLRWLDFEDIRDGILRIFAFPDFEGEVRIVTVVDEAAASVVLAGTARKPLQQKRLLQFLHAAAAAPAAARWLTTFDLGRPDSRGRCSSLFPHQEATLAWMRGVEKTILLDGSREEVRVELINFAGVELGSSYEVKLPSGGVIAHPPGAGKTRIVASLLATSSEPEEFQHVKTLIVCPSHLQKQWKEELEVVGASAGAEIADYDSIASRLPATGKKLGWDRMVIDEPQDCPGGEPWTNLLMHVGKLHESNAPLWLLCGTAQKHLDTIGLLLLGRRDWHCASRTSEWRGCPELPHIIRSRFISDPPWACLPMPSLQVEDVPVILRPKESADAAVASFAGFAIDGVMLLSYGAEAAFAAAKERDEMLLQIGWGGSVGKAMLPIAEHTLKDWEGAVAQRSQEKLEELVEEIKLLESEEGKHAARYQLTGGDAAVVPDLSFLAREAVRVEIKGLQGSADLSEEACTAEWNTLLHNKTFDGVLIAEQDGARIGQSRMPGGHISLRKSPEDSNFAKAATEAGFAGALAVVFEADRKEPRPFGYSHDQEPPSIPAAMISQTLASQIRASLLAGANLTARVSITYKADSEAIEDIDQGVVSGFIADDVVEDELHRRLKSLRDERECCERSLRFAKQMRAVLEKNEANCPVCLHSGGELDAFAVMPDCFHFICRACLHKQAGLEQSFACPMCRVSVSRLDVVVFQAPSATDTVESSANQAIVQTDVSARTASTKEHSTVYDEPGKVEEERGSAQKRDGETDGERMEATMALVKGGLSATWEALPSKLARVVNQLQELLASGPEERILVYTQWVVHVAYIKDLLAKYDVPSLALDGDLRETMHSLSRFGKPDEPRVLLLSSQRHSSGINLQAARHIIIVHPYCTPTATSQESISRSQMLAYEAQAIGRVRRYPQQKPVHIYRFFAADTIEEELYAGR